MEQLFRTLADRTRLRLLNLMSGQEVCVCYFVEILGLPQSTISRHLAYMRRAGLVESRREGKWMHYRLSVPKQPSLQAVLREVLKSFQSDKAMERDRTRLNRASCAPKKFIRLEGAPVPSANPARSPRQVSQHD
jgi:ArsR family transcriptional regulator, arsenate/arsenite/antimonite-responsive transcriptional repressor